MKFGLDWLREHLETEAAAGQIAERLTALGLEIEGVVDRGRDLAPFAVALVREARQHPNADRLKLCVVETAQGTFEVVCGAPNARTGMKAIFAPEGAYIPGLKTVLKAAKIRGVESRGMLLSAREMGLGDDHAGIVEAEPELAVGTPAAVALGLAEPAIDIKVTPNRGDCLGVRGIARDLAAAGAGRLKPLDMAAVPGTFESPLRVAIDGAVLAAGACSYFVGRLITGVTNRESPAWVKDRLTAAGLRPISALVDVTNLLTLGLGRPLHVFDADRVQGGLTVRFARPGERFRALNDKDYDLDPEMTAIADAAGADALGGIMGGERTGCTDATVNVFIESALFDPVRTAATGRKLGIQSDARYRFERGVDAAFTAPGIEIATRLIRELCGGQASHLVVAGAPPAARPPIAFRPARIGTLGGVAIAEAEWTRILEALGFVVEGAGETRSVRVPTWRGDIVGEACLVEEVVRVAGYDRVPAVPVERPGALPGPALNGAQRRRVTARRVLAARGLLEAVTLSFVPAREADAFGGVPDSLKLVNPISADLDVMRPSLLPNLVAAARRNAQRGTADVALFEVGPQYAGDLPEDQAFVAAGVRAGDAQPRHWSAPARAADALDAKSDALAVLAAVGLAAETLAVKPSAASWYHPGRSGSLMLGPHLVLAQFGELHPQALAAMDAKGPLAAFEVFLDRVPAPKLRGPARPALKLSAFQPVARDFAFVVDAGVAAGAVLAAARKADPLVSEVKLFDAFAGGAVGEGRKSLAIGVTLQPLDRTLTDAEIEGVAARIVAAVAAATGGQLRA